METVHQCFKEHSAERLRQWVCGWVDATPKGSSAGAVRALIVPGRFDSDSGPVAAAAFRAVQGEPFDTVAIVASSPVGAFQRISITEVDAYETPLGVIRIDDGLRNELCDEDDDIFLSSEGHEHNAGIEAQLPFLQCVLPGSFGLVPIVMGWETWDFCRELGSALGEVLSIRNALLIAAAEVRSATQAALAELVRLLEGLEVERLSAFLHAQQVELFGVGPVLATLMAAGDLGANRARVVALRHRADGSADLGLLVYRAD
ncbi:MAG: AmmeMemoRadiSam system protein B [Bacteroidetes bacterium]|nr:AmmeMemoRadiSam system protein B [Rhodothermia bacterium]MCS7154776.1 AmmeMemoRadiSam system protein B [Bacteroidota bacterium]MCX7907067.1 AmmeMemoRadiSam system protein B [Bacteroidota bacterium]MDW8137569.1 AmmeMemoRadiSam system protein B [Bacteroidota bacterium]MDW8285477.1 AmmeMemoRadiSam system protein B [Bacteroidota bacterium]